MVFSFTHGASLFILQRQKWRNQVWTDINDILILKFSYQMQDGNSGPGVNGLVVLSVRTKQVTMGEEYIV